MDRGIKCDSKYAFGPQDALVFRPLFELNENWLQDRVHSIIEMIPDQSSIRVHDHPSSRKYSGVWPIRSRQTPGHKVGSYFRSDFTYIIPSLCSNSVPFVGLGDNLKIFRYSVLKTSRC